jgi:hypothetical protein
VSLGSHQHIVERIGFLEQAPTTDVGRRAHDVDSPHGYPNSVGAALANILRFDKLTVIWPSMAL